MKPVSLIACFLAALSSAFIGNVRLVTLVWMVACLIVAIEEDREG